LFSLAGTAHASVIYDLKSFKVDDEMTAKITNSDFNETLILDKTFGPDYPYVDISSFVRPGSNKIDLALFNGPQGYTYGYDLRKNGVSLLSESCGIFNHGGCDNNSTATGLVWTRSLTFTVASAVPELSTWAMMIAGIGLAGYGRRRITRMKHTQKFA
jgi:hypothetical protein